MKDKTFYLVDLVKEGIAKYLEAKPETKEQDEENWQTFVKTWMRPSVVARLVMHMQDMEEEIEELKEKLAEKEK